MSLNNNQKSLLLGFPESRTQASKLAELMEVPYADIEIHRFPDGESKVTLPVDMIESCKQVFIYRSLNNPNEKLIELLLASEGVKTFGEIKQTQTIPIQNLPSGVYIIKTDKNLVLKFVVI